MKTALLYAVQELGADELERRRADLAASYQRAIVRALVGGHGSGGETGSRRSQSSEASPPTRSFAPPFPARLGPARALHRQCGDDRLRGTLGRAVPLPGYLALDAHAAA